MHAVELSLALLVAVAVLARIAAAVRVPYPILLVLGGLALALAPQVPDVALEPDLVFLLFLPPLLYVTAFYTGVRDVRTYLRSIASLAIGLVLASTATVAVVAHWLFPDIGWATAFALGAIVSPPDAVAATAVFRRLSVPRHVVTLLEGESLFNDATALVAYRAAIVAMATATFSASSAVITFLVVSVGGVLVGVGVGTVIAGLRRRLSDPPIEITVSLLTPFAAYLAAEELGTSGVLATVTSGLCLGWWAPRIMEPETRVRGEAVWNMLIFVLNGMVFILIGLQLSTILVALYSRSLLALIGYGALVSLAAIATRMVWVLAGAWLVRLRGEHAPWNEALVVGWAGMRGVISLATALALPLETPERDLLLFLVFCVILVTLVGQGLTLPWVLRASGLCDEGAGAEIEQHARSIAVAAAGERIEQLVDEWPGHLPLIETLRAQYSHRVSHLGEDGAAENLTGTEAEQELVEHRLIRRAVIDAERAALLNLRQRGELDDDTWRRLERDLDLEELRLEA